MMTAAIANLTGPAVRRRGGRLLCVLGLVLPIPLCAALGLSIPLPTTVERLAAKLVPFAHSESTAAPSRGSITLTRNEQPQRATPSIPKLAALATARRSPGKTNPARPALNEPHAVKPGTSEAASRAEETGEAAAPAKGAAPATSTTAGAATEASSPPPATAAPAPVPAPSGSGSSDPPKTSPPVIETATNTVNQTVTTVTNTGNDTTETVNDTVGTATGVGGGLLPKKP